MMTANPVNREGVPGSGRVLGPLRSVCVAAAAIACAALGCGDEVGELAQGEADHAPERVIDGPVG